MKLTFYGAAKEVGRSCIKIDGEYNSFLFDSGLKIGKEESEYPLEFDMADVDCVFLSHAHLDHCGALPLFNFNGMHAPIFTTHTTKEISKIILKDSYHVSQLKEETPAYSADNIYDVFALFEEVKLNKIKTYKDLEFEFFDAGHIPGSSLINVKIDNKNILYTGDFNLTDTYLLKGSDILSRNQKVDYLICESTYGDRLHNDRTKEIESFKSKIRETLDRNGVVMIPSFALGRAQEVLLILESMNLNVPIYLDGMAKRVTRLILKNPNSIKDFKKLDKIDSKTKYVKKQPQRAAICNSPCVIVTTSGMLDGGPIMDYMKHTYNNSNNSILLVGYQAENTNGRSLMEKGTVHVDEEILKIKCEYHKFDFSAHAGQDELIQMIDKLNPKKVFFIHGDPSSIEEISKLTSNNHEVYTPNLGESFEFD